jgi:hypothetical protein
MTPDEWKACEDPSAMLDLVGDRATDRKLRLFLIACCRRIWPMLADERSRTAVEVAQQFADGIATPTELAAAHEATKAALADKAPGAPANATAPHLQPARKVGYDRNRPVMLDVREGASRAVSCVANNRLPDATHTWAETVRDERSFQASVLRDIFGYPYPFVGFDPAWRTPQAVELATEIYTKPLFNRMFELGNLLQDAGCSETIILSHCRTRAMHFRGCWLVDLVLGKE